MAAITFMLSFQLPKKLAPDIDMLEALKTFGNVCLEENLVSKQSIDAGKDKIIVFTGENGSCLTYHVYASGLVTLDIQQFKNDYDPCNADDRFQMFKFLRCLRNKLEKEVSKTFNSSIEGLLVPISRGPSCSNYTVLGDNRLLQTDYDNLVFHQTSKYQDVKIVHSRSLGNALLLDEEIMLAESDLIYTETLLGLKRNEDYFNKEILILGGGDGGILHELLKRQPKFVTMAEIDDVVIQGCRSHMRGVCGDAMDKYEGDNYQIRIADCVDVLKEALQNGKHFDYVVNDLTEFPVNLENYDFDYDFETTSIIAELSMKVLKPSGKLLMRGGEFTNPQLVHRLEGDIQRFGSSYKRYDVFVPSFAELYVIFEVWKTSDAPS